MENTRKLPQRIVTPNFIGNSKIEFVERGISSPGRGQLLIKVKANALCGSERGQFFNGSDVVPGHEASGIVVDTGPGTSTAIGTQGVIFLMDFCGECRNCKSGFTNQCESKRADYGFNHHGGYSPYMVINENVFFEIDSSIPLTEATMLLDIMGTGGHAIKRAKLVHPDIQSIVIGGAGPIGLGTLAMIKITLGKNIPVFIMDYVPYRLNLAQKLGAIPVDLNGTSLENVMAIHNYAGVDTAIDTTGKTAARQQMLQLLNKRGVLVCVGHGQELNLQVSSDLIAMERAVLGSEYFQYSEIVENHKLIKENLSYLQPIITHRYPLDQIQEAFEVFFEGSTGKVIIEHE